MFLIIPCPTDGTVIEKTITSSTIFLVYHLSAIVQAIKIYCEYSHGITMKLPFLSFRIA